MKANAKSPFRIVPFTNPSGNEAFRVTGFKRTGERVRQNYPSRDEATGAMEVLLAEYQNADTGTKLRSTRLTADELMDAERAYPDLLPGKTLVDAVRFYAKNYREKKGISIASGYAEFIKEKEDEGLRPATIRNLKQRLGVMVREIGALDIATVKPDDIRPIFSSRSPVDANNYRRAFSGFFSWAVVKEYRESNPLKACKPKRENRGAVKRMSVDEVRNILKAATAHKGGILVPYVSLAIFAGLRPDSELVRVPWEQIHIDDEYIQIFEQDTKAESGRGARVVEMVRINKKSPANLALWLKPHHGKTPIYPANWRNEFDTIKEAAGWGTPTLEKPHLKPWPQDIMRHTAISFHFKFTDHEGKTAKWAGNSPNIVHSRYKTPANSQELKAFWSIVPNAIK